MTRGRPRNFDPDLVLENAMQLFWRKGYEATSLQDLLDTTGLSKSSLYESFGNKQQVFEAAFTRYFNVRAQLMSERLARASSPLAFIHDCLLSALDDAESDTPRGCMLVNVANEFSTGHAAFQPLIQLATQRFRDVFEQAFVQAQSTSAMSAEKAPTHWALYMHCAMSGLRTQSKSGLAKQDLLQVIGLIMASLR